LLVVPRVRLTSVLRILLLQLSGLGILLSPVACAAGISPCCASVSEVEKPSCRCDCHGSTSGESGRRPVDEDGEERECVAFRARTGVVIRSAGEFVRALAEMPAEPSGCQSAPVVRTIDSHRPTAERESADSALPLRTLVCALLL
jgi:hypothetical protein